MDTNMNEGVHAFLDCSVAHLTPKDKVLLEHWAAEEGVTYGRPIPYRTIAHKYGWIVHVRLDEAEDRKDAEAQACEEGISETFFEVQAYARKHGCWWINFDADADEISGLAVWEWEDGT